MNLQNQVDELHTRVGRIAVPPPLADLTRTAADLTRTAPDPGQTGVDQVVGTAAASISLDSRHQGPSGHRDIAETGGLAHGVVTTLALHPANGTFPPRHTSPSFRTADLSGRENHY